MSDQELLTEFALWLVQKGFNPPYDRFVAESAASLFLRAKEKEEGGG